MWGVSTVPSVLIGHWRNERPIIISKLERFNSTPTFCNKGINKLWYGLTTSPGLTYWWEKPGLCWLSFWSSDVTSSA